MALSGTTASDTFYLRKDSDGQHLDIWLNSLTPGIGAPSEQALIGGYNGILIQGNGGNDSVTVDESAGEILPAGASANTVTTSAAGTVALNLIGTSDNDIVMLDGSARSASIGGKSIAVTGGTLANLGFTSTGGTDALTINGTVPVALTVNSGTVTIPANSGTGIRPVNFSSLSIGATGTFKMAASSSTVGDYSKHANRSVAVIAIGGLSIASVGTLDLEDNDLVLRYTPTLAGSTAAKSQVNGLIASSFDGGAWDLPSLTSFAAAADVSGSRAVGWGDNLDLGLSSFDGVDVSDGTEILVKFTYFGDATLDGKVDAADNGQVAAGLQGAGTGWAFGDFDYSGGKPTAADNNLFAAGLAGYTQFGQL